MARGEELTDEQWAVIEPHLPELPRREDGRGRPWRSNREVMNGILWILRSGARWKDLPDRFPPYQTCHRRFQAWVRDGTLRRVLEGLAEDLRTRGELDLSECFIDATFIVAKKGGRGVGKTKRGKGTKLMVVADTAGFPVAADTTSASPHEVTLVHDTLHTSFTGEQPERLIGDKAYDSDPLDEELTAEGIEMIAPHKLNRKKTPTQDGRSLRRYRRRWKVARLIAWLQNFRRIATRFDYHDENYLGFVHLGCIKIFLRCYL
ncbi:MAG TPA: IS5 family transposase [Pyrinomonadaceae bacterium]|nr:IS5 family transposase [Pyrinomonadaceae bacterium]